MKYLHSMVLSLMGALLLSCGGSGSSQAAQEETTATQEVAAEEVAQTISLVIESNDMMQFNLTKLEVTEGQTVSLTLKHVGQMSKDAMGHNWVLLVPGTDKATFGAAAVSARETSYIPEDMKDQVIAFTEVVGGGEETTITFEAPAAGYYDFICSFPGHYGVMQGSFVVKPK